MNAPINDGGPAFAATIVVDDKIHMQSGMTLRDWFAGQALAGLIPILAQSEKQRPWDEACEIAYAAADAMIAAREGRAK